MVSVLPRLSAQLPDLVESAKKELLIASPYVGREGTDLVVGSLCKEFRRSGVLRFLTDLSPMNVCQSATDPAAILDLSRHVVSPTLVHLPRLHAKVYIADKRRVIITSANLTRGGLLRNYEYGVEIRDATFVARVHTDLVAISELGAKVELPELESYCNVARQLRDAYVSVASTASRQLQLGLRHAEDQLVRMRLRGGAMHSVFARTILYLLKRHGPLITEAIHPLVSQLHPDLCDNTVDRIIDGHRFGKKWKHAVRTAQQQLKKRGAVEYDGTHWKLTTSQPSSK